MKKPKNSIDIWVFDQKRINLRPHYKAIKFIMKQYHLDNIGLSYNDKGKPILTEENMKISIAKRDAVVLYAFSWKQEIGVDIEKKVPLQDIESLSKYIFSEIHIQDILYSIDGDIVEAFYKHWTLYEAFAKWLGSGLAYVLENKTVINKSCFFSSNFMIHPFYIGTVVCEKKKNIQFIQNVPNKI